MNKITFDEMLYANGLPLIGDTVTTPTGEQVEIIAYVYDMYDDVVRVRLNHNDCVVDWSHSQIKECTWEGKDEKEKTVFN